MAEFAVTLKDLSKVLNVSTSTIKRWIKEGMPYEENKYNIAEIKSWVENKENFCTNKEDIVVENNDIEDCQDPIVAEVSIDQINVPEETLSKKIYQRSDKFVKDGWSKENSVFAWEGAD